MPYSTCNFKSRFYKIVLRANPYREQEDLDLKRNFERYENNHEIFNSLLHQNSTKIVANFFIGMVLNHQPIKQQWELQNRVEMAWRHLQCFCGKICYRVAEKLANYNNTGLLREQVAENFDYAKVFIYDLGKFQKLITGYDTSRDSFPSYVSRALVYHVKDLINSDMTKYTKMRLLDKKSDKALKEALVRKGYLENQISQIIFARHIFKLIYRKNHRDNPDQQREKGSAWIEANYLDYEEAAKYYNSTRCLVSAPLSVFSGQDITPGEMEKFMEISIQALLDISHPKIIAIDIDKNLENDLEADLEAESEIISNYNNDEDSNLSSHIDKQAYKVIEYQFLSLKRMQQQRIILEYGFDFIKQTEIADILSTHQTTISRSNHQVRKILIKHLLSESNFYKSAQPLQEWSANYVKKLQLLDSTNLFDSILHESARKLSGKRKEVYELKYGQRMNDLEIAVKLGYISEYIMKLIDEMQVELTRFLLDEISNLCNKIVEKTLSNYCKQLIDLAKNNSNIQADIYYYNQESKQIIYDILNECLNILTARQQGAKIDA